MVKYTPEEKKILNNCKVDAAYSYIKTAIETFTTAEIELCLRNMDKRANYEQDAEQRRIYRTIIKELKDLLILRMNETIDDMELSKDLFLVFREYQELKSKKNPTQLDKRRIKKLKKLLQNAQEIDTYENDRNDTGDDIGDYDLSQYYEYE